jgi:hypothetical protein
LFTVATAVLDDVQGLVAFAVPDPVSCVVPLAQAVSVPEIVGNGLMVIVNVIGKPSQKLFV